MRIAHLVVYHTFENAYVVKTKNELKVKSNQADKRFSLESFKGGSSQETTKMHDCTLT